MSRLDAAFQHRNQERIADGPLLVVLQEDGRSLGIQLGNGAVQVAILPVLEGHGIADFPGRATKMADRREVVWNAFQVHTGIKDPPEFAILKVTDEYARPAQLDNDGLHQSVLGM